MSRERRAKWLCKAKVYHATETLALEAATDMERRKNLNPGVLSAFRCTACDGWHIGRITKRVAKVRATEARS